jgi:glycosyltransferase involved in cell wall biosynthesis
VAVLGYVRARTRSWPDASRLFVVGDGFSWSIDEDARFVAATARELGYVVAPARWARHASRQVVFLPDHFSALDPRWLQTTHELGLAYFHGRPGTIGYPEFDLAYERLRRNPERVARIQVTHDEMRDLVLESGVDPERVFKIRLGVDPDRFTRVDAESRRDVRQRLGVPASAFVVGSFQKDGVGLGEGFEPKLIKGPDVLLATLEQAAATIPDLFVLLTGLARGYVRAGLEQLGIPYRHVLFATHEELAHAYHALDAYVVTARQEGGPKGPLEAMATGVPVVTTRVGQTQEIVEDGRNGLLADVEDADALAHGLLRLSEDQWLRATLAREGPRTAVAHDTAHLIPEWGALLNGFVREPADSVAGVPVRRPPSPAWRAEVRRRRRFALTAAALFMLWWLFITLPEELGDKPYDPNGLVHVVGRLSEPVRHPAADI